MPSTSNTIRKGIASVGEKVAELAWTVGRDRREEARTRRRWGVLQGVVTAGLTLAARRVALRAWNVLTGEAPPVAGQEAREAMWARVASYEIPIGSLDQGIQAFQNATTSLREMDGASAAYLLVDRASGKALTVTLWDSEDALSASESAADRLRREAVGEAVRNVERYEIALHETFT